MSMIRVDKHFRVTHTIAIFVDIQSPSESQDLNVFQKKYFNFICLTLIYETEDYLLLKEL